MLDPRTHKARDNGWYRPVRSTWEEGRSGVHGHPQLNSKSDVSLGYVKLCLKISKQYRTGLDMVVNV